MKLFGRFRRKPEEESGFFADAQNDSIGHADALGGLQPDIGSTGLLAAEEAAFVQPIGTEQIREAMQTLRKYKAGKANFQGRLIENEQWWKGRHWNYMNEQGTTELKTKSAWLVNVILSKHADAMDAIPEPNFLPREPGDEGEAAILSQVVPVILSRTDFDEAWNANWWKKLKAGVAFYGIFWDGAALNGLGDIAIREIDPLHLYWEPGIKKLQDSRNLFLVEWVDNDILKEQFPELAEEPLAGKAFTEAKYIYDDAVDMTGKSPVIDWYYKKREGTRTVLHYVKFVGETVLYATENDAGAQAGNSESAPGGLPMGEAAGLDAETERFGALQAPGAESPSVRGLYDHGLYPFEGDVLFPEEGTPAGFGYVDICKDPQRQIDLMNNAIVANCVAAATPRWFKRGDDGVNEEEYADWTKPFVHVQGSIEENVLRQITIAPLSGNYLNILESKINEMKETSGNRDVNNGGAPSGVTAASAIAAMQEQSGKLSRDQIATSYKTFRRICYQVIALIRQFYDVPRKIRITGESGATQYIAFDNKGLQDKLVPAQNGNPAYSRRPEFDIEVAPQKQSAYSKLSQNELALQFYNVGFFNPGQADPALAALQMMDFKDREKVMQMVQKNGTMFQLLQQLSAKLQMYEAALGIGGSGGGGPAAPQGGGPSARGEGPGGLPENGPTGEQVKHNTITDRARGQAQAATQPR